MNFSLIANTTIGGLSLTAASADSDPGTGLVQTIVQAGTASTPVRVSATIDGTTPAIATTSDQLVISTGIPDQNSFSIAAAPLNIEGWDLDGITSDITVKLADHYNNPAPNGTAVYFRSSGGSVQPSCMTTDGTCKATFTSQAPREKVINPGRVVILAYALGEESFVDLNGNGIYDTTIPDTFTDMWEPFLDANEDGLKGASEEFVDTNADGLYNKDGVFNGILRDAAITGSTTIHVRNSVTVVLSGSAADITLRNILGNPIVTAALSTCVNTVPFVNTPVELKINIVDVNGNVMPAGTKIEFSASNGTIINKPVSWTMPSTSAKTNGTFTYTVIMESDATQLTVAPFTCTNAKKDGRLIVQVTTPKGLLTAQSFSVTD